MHACMLCIIMKIKAEFRYPHESPSIRHRNANDVCYLTVTPELVIAGV